MSSAALRQRGAPLSARPEHPPPPPRLEVSSRTSTRRATPFGGALRPTRARESRRSCGQPCGARAGVRRGIRWIHGRKGPCTRLSSPGRPQQAHHMVRSGSWKAPLRALCTICKIARYDRQPKQLWRMVEVHMVTSDQSASRHHDTRGETNSHEGCILTCRERSRSGRRAREEGRRRAARVRSHSGRIYYDSRCAGSTRASAKNRTLGGERPAVGAFNGC